MGCDTKMINHPFLAMKIRFFCGGSYENRQTVYHQHKKSKLEGDYQNGIYVFKGIPYAAAPVGNLRCFQIYK